MSGSEYDIMRRAEDAHWWYRALRFSVARELSLAAPRGTSVLDAGCGTGGGLGHWRSALRARAYGVDLSAAAIAHCRERGERLIARASVMTMPFRDEVFDVVVSLDVLCLDGVDEQRTLEEMRRVLRPRGILVVNVPAFAGLSGQHDRAVRIRRRFTRSELVAAVRSSGFEVLRVRYWNTLLFPIAWLVRRWRSAGEGAATSDLAPAPRLLNGGLTALLRAEAATFGWEAPFGTSVMCIARRVESRVP